MAAKPTKTTKPTKPVPKITTEQRDRIKEILIQHYGTVPMFLVIDEKTKYIHNAIELKISRMKANKLIRELEAIDDLKAKSKPINNHSELYGVWNEIHKLRAKRKKLVDARERLDKLESLITELPVLIERQRYKIRKLEREEDSLGDMGKEEETTG